MKFITQHWYEPDVKPAVVLSLLSALYQKVIVKKRRYFLANKNKVYRAPVPVIVVGNITVGGTGKTPVVIALSRYLTVQGYQVGVISRGYGGKSKTWPQEVCQDADPIIVGDEPALIKQHSACPVFVGPNRQADVEALLKQYPETNVIISDDGLQHYALARDIEIAVIDSARMFGNQHLLPAGPLREPLSRLKEVDIQLYNGKDIHSASSGTFNMQLLPSSVYQLNHVENQKNLADFSSQTVHAVAGIGHPQRFFNTLESAGIQVIPHAFTDHHQYKADDLLFAPDLPLLMTEKDAVKCQKFKLDNAWVVSVSAEFTPGFYEKLEELLKFPLNQLKR